MHKSAFNLLLVVLIEAICAVAAYLKDRLMGSLHRSGDDEPWANHPEFA
ncbi:hypothetical protein OYT13_18775 [Pandoraea sp. XJJ-1]|nr:MULTISPECIES: hypothetical protein [unclassified Pandoraea]WAL81849.1 hypothetical protein OYT13_18775 [Pandoraea sp. XJJ-1]